MSPGGGPPDNGAALVDRWPFVGRRVDLERALDAVLEPSLGGVLVSGGPGLGKTRLVQELLAELAVLGRPTASAVASTTVAQVPLGALAHLLPPDVLLGDDARGELDALRVLALARRALTPDEGRVVLHIDDAHLLDAVSLTLITQLVQDGSATLALTVRTGEPVPDALAGLWRAGHLRRIELSPLGPDSVDTLLHLALGAPVDGRATLALRQAGSGNPLFLRELVRAGVESGSLALVDGVWRLDGPLPHAHWVEELFESRVGRVNIESRAVLDLLATVGPVPLDLLSLVTPIDLLEQLEADELIELDAPSRPGDPETIRLAHPLFGDLLRRSIPTLRRRSILVQHADRVDAWEGQRPDDAMLVATWRLEGGHPVEPSILEAAAHLARVGEDFELTLRLAGAAHRVRPTLDSAVLCGEALFELGRWDEAEATLAAASSSATDADDDLDARLRLVATRTTNLLFGLLRPDDALAIAQEELAAHPRRDPVVQSELRSRIALLHMYSGDAAAAAQTLGSPPEPGDDPRFSRQFVMWANPGVLTTALAGHTTDAIALAERALALHSDLGGSVGTANLHTHVLTWCAALQEAGRFDDALGVADAGYRGAVEAGSATGQAWFALNLGRIALARGMVTTGQRWFREALSVTAATGWLGQRTIALSGLAATAAAVGDVHTARQSLAAIESFPGRFGFLQPERCLGAVWCATAEGRLDEARGILVAHADLAAETGHRTTEVWLCHELARLGASATVVDRMAAVAAASDSALVHARLHHARALADRDPEALTAAGAELEALGCWLAAAEAYGRAADLTRSQGDQRSVNALAGRSAACLERCEGARSEVELSVTGAVVPLTAREREIATLAAAGVTSKDIAARLYLSVRTVNNHLQNAYTKLGVSSRSELAEILGRRPEHG